MEPSHGASVTGDGPGVTRKQELATFLIATFVIIPGLAVAFVGAYGFFIWASQMIFGPPGPPG